MKSGVTISNQESVSMQWKYPDSNRAMKFKTQQSVGKVTLTACFHSHGPLLLEFKEPDPSINVLQYTQTLDTLHKATKNKVQVCCRQMSPFCTTIQGRMSLRCMPRH
ncbi:hypothetical protein TNCV_3300971 [Trichonephila clavipes]|nr:hypothetical protein TNCV_3300971 [Trichonephila clavipes]